jgi:hypothetical protein
MTVRARPQLLSEAASVFANSAPKSITRAHILARLTDIIDSAAMDADVGDAIDALILRLEALEAAETGVTSPFTKNFEYFGGVASGFDTTGNEADRTAALANKEVNDAAFDDASQWTNDTGGHVLFGGGVYGHEETIRLRSNLNFIGTGGRNGTKFLMLDTLWPTCMAPLLTGTPTTDGAAFITLKGIEINGGWNFLATYGGSGNWRHFGVADMTQIGLHLTTPTGGANDLLDTHRTDTVDSFDMIADVTIRNVAGKGFLCEGRGEKFMQLLRIASCATDGMDMSSVDNWLSQVTIHNCGNRGLVFNAGNQRMESVKTWYIGMMEDEEPQGVGIEFASSSMTAVSTSNVSTQDTYGPGVRLRGRALKGLNFEINEPAGGRLDQFAQGWPGTRTRSNSALEIVQADNCEITIAATGSITEGDPYLVDFNGGSSFDNVITVVHPKRQADPFWNTTTPVRTSTAYGTNKCFNVVKTHDGTYLHGAVATSRLSDAVDQVNTYKGLGFKALITDGRWATKTGSDATSPWQLDDGSTITPA